MNISKAMVQEQFVLERVHHVGEEEHLEQFGSPKTPWKKLGVPSCNGETVVHKGEDRRPKQKICEMRKCFL